MPNTQLELLLYIPLSLATILPATPQDHLCAQGDTPSPAPQAAG